MPVVRTGRSKKHEWNAAQSQNFSNREPPQSTPWWHQPPRPHRLRHSASPVLRLSSLHYPHRHSSASRPRLQRPRARTTHHLRLSDRRHTMEETRQGKSNLYLQPPIQVLGAFPYNLREPNWNACLKLGSRNLRGCSPFTVSSASTSQSWFLRGARVISCRSTTQDMKVPRLKYAHAAAMLQRAHWTRLQAPLL
jgi:hypothetical protein